MTTAFFLRPVGRIACGLTIALPCAVRAQQSIPVRQIGTAEARSKDTVGTIFGVHELSDGRLVVNDATNRRLLMFSAALGAFTQLADTVSGSGKPYGGRGTGIIPFAGDSTLLVDVFSRGLVMVSPTGAMGRVLAMPKTNDAAWLANPSFGQGGIDPKGRLIYRGYQAYREHADSSPRLQQQLDSAPVVRADFETRALDTLGLLGIPVSRVSTTKMADGRTVSQLLVNPLPLIDDWALLPDGAIAILRGQDYHVDWVNADGTRLSTPKMPFEWKHLTDTDKQAIVDSVQKVVTQQWAAQNAAVAAGVPGAAPAGASAAVGGMGRVGSADDANSGGPRPAPPQRPAPIVIPAELLPDYIPPVLRQGVMRADPEGNLWILPSTSTLGAGALIYDVVNRKGEIAKRVRLPVGRALAGFGAKGALYLTAHDSTGTHLERTRIPK